MALEGARAYTHGGHSIEGLEHTHVNRFRGYNTMLAYRRAEALPESPNIRRSYRALRNDVNRQYDFMTRPRDAGGMGLSHEVTEKDPYGNAAQMAKDVRSGRIRTLSSERTPHAFLSPEENDRFRAVHDVFGHAATGRGFDRHGEEAAYLSHRQMFSKAAQQALASETRGQNSVLNYGLRGFPDQGPKLIGLPGFASRKK